MFFLIYQQISDLLQFLFLSVDSSYQLVLLQLKVLDKLFLGLKAALNKLDLFRISKSVLAPDDVLKLRPQSSALFYVNAKLKINFVRLCGLNVPLEDLKFLGPRGDQHVHLFDLSLEIERQMAL
jgi:hypothetical protein